MLGRECDATPSITTWTPRRLVRKVLQCDVRNAKESTKRVEGRGPTHATLIKARDWRLASIDLPRDRRARNRGFRSPQSQAEHFEVTSQGPSPTVAARIWQRARGDCVGRRV